jgi:hypothetical protein
MKSMLTLSDIFVLGVAHWIGDFVLQSHTMACNKSKDNAVLAQHVVIYSLCMVCAGVILFWGNDTLWPAVWVLANAALHFGQDFVTSRMTAKRWKVQCYHDFFEVVGFDQMLHLFCLTTLLVYLR